MSTIFVAPTQNFLSKTLSGGINDSVTTITLNNATNVQAPGYAVINRENSAETPTPGSREVIYFTGISGSDLTGVTRAADGSTARTHADGALIEFTMTAGMWNSLATIIATGFTGDGYLKAINSPVSIARLETPLLKASSVLASIATILGHLNVSGASIVGFNANVGVARATATKSAAQSINNNTETAVTWNTEDYDVGAMHDTVTNNDRITIPTTGFYLLIAELRYASNATGGRGVIIKLNGTTSEATTYYAAHPTDVTLVSVSKIVNATAADYYNVYGLQSSGGALDIENNRSFFQAIRLT